MVAMKEVDSIEIVPDGTATHRRLRVLLNGADGARQERVIAEKRVAAAALLPSHEGYACLPDGARFHASDNGVHVFVLEKAPGRRSVEWKIHPDWVGEPFRREAIASSGLHRSYGQTLDAFRERIATQRSFYLAFPYVVQIVVFHGETFHSTYCYYRTAPLRTALDELYEANLPNQYSPIDRDKMDGMICLPRQTAECASVPGLSYAQRIQIVDEAFWGSGWNKDLTVKFVAAATRIREVQSPWHWEAASRASEYFMRDLPWQPLTENIGELMDRHLNRAVEKGDIYSLLVQRVACADRFDATPVADDRISVSPSSFIATIVGTLTVGDAVTVAPGAFAECPQGGTFIVRWFGRPETQGSRFVALEGVDAPLRLILNHALAQGITIVGAARGALTVGDVTISEGDILRFAQLGEWPEARTHAWRIAGVYRSASESVLVDCVGAAGRATFVIGVGDALYDGLQVIPKPDVDRSGRLRVETLTLADGTTFRKGETYFTYNGRSVVLFEIAAFVPPDPDRGTSVYGVSTVSGGHYNIENAAGCALSTMVRTPEQPITSVECGGVCSCVGDRVFRVPDTGASEIIRTIAPEFPGVLARFVELSHSGWVPLSSVQAAPLLSVADDGTWAQLDDTRFAVGQAYFDPKERRVRVAQTFLRCEDAGSVDIAFAPLEGQLPYAPFIRDFRTVFTWQVVAESVALGASFTLGSGDTLRLTRTVDGKKAGTAFTVAYIIPATSKEPMTVVTEDGLGIPLSQENAEHFEGLPEDPHAYPQTQYKRGLARNGFITVDGSRARARCVNPGTCAGEDWYGNLLYVGDRVRFVEGKQPSSDSPLKAHDLAQSGHPFTIVHAASAFGVRWLLLSAGEDIGRRFAPGVAGWDTMPADLRDDPSWWASVCHGQSVWCERVHEPEATGEGGKRT